MNIQVPRAQTLAEEQLAADFAARKNALAGGARLQLAREEAFARFADRGIPHRRIEEFKYTDLRARLRDVPGGGETTVALSGGADGVHVQPLSEALEADEGLLEVLSERLNGFESAMLDLNQAFASTGAAVRVDAGRETVEPVRVVFTHPAGERGDSQAIYTVGEGAKATIVEKVTATGEGSPAA